MSHADVAERHAIYRRLDRRNRVVGVLRIGVPVLGVLVLVALLAQIYLSSLGGRFSVGQVSVSLDSISVDAPEYAGVMTDGTVYRVLAREAFAATHATDQISMRNAELTMTRPDGVVMTVEADEALLDTAGEKVVVAGVARIANSLGTRGTVENSVFDYVAQTLTGVGPVEIDYADGTHLVAEGIYYDVNAVDWTFTRSTVTLPDTPGAKTTP